MRKRILSLLLSVIMAFSLLPATVLAVDDDPNTRYTSGGIIDANDEWSNAGDEAGEVVPGEYEPDAEPDTESDAESEEKSDVESEEKPDAESEEKSDAESEEKSDAESEEKSDAESEEKSDAESEEKSDAEPEEESDAELDAELDAERDTPAALSVDPDPITLYTGGGIIDTNDEWNNARDEFGEVIPGKYESDTESAITFPTPTMKDASLEFEGWYKDAKYQDKADAPEDGGTYYAKWNRTTSFVDGDTMTYEYKSSAIDAHGKATEEVQGDGGTTEEVVDIQTTYSNGGYAAYYAMGTVSPGKGGTELRTATSGDPFVQVDGTDLYVAQIASFEGAYVRFSYYIWNRGSEAVESFNLGAAADVQIGNDDNAALTLETDGAGSYVNMFDNSGKYELRMYYDGSVVTPAATLWTGGYNGGSYPKYVFDNDPQDRTGIDSAVCFSWQDLTIPADGLVVKSVLFGCGKAGSLLISVLDKAKQIIDEVLSTYPGTNETTEEDLRQAIEEALKEGLTQEEYDSIEWEFTNGPDTDPATPERKGSITGDIEISLKDPGDDVLEANRKRDTSFDVNISREGTWTVFLHPNGGGGDIQLVTVYPGSYTLPICPFVTPEGWEFAGWSYTKDGEILTDASIDIQADTVLYAIWKTPTEYAVTVHVTHQSDGSPVTDAVMALTANQYADESTWIYPKYFNVDEFEPEDGYGADGYYYFENVPAGDYYFIFYWVPEDERQEIYATDMVSVIDRDQTIELVIPDGDLEVELEFSNEMASGSSITGAVARGLLEAALADLQPEEKDASVEVFLVVIPFDEAFIEELEQSLEEVPPEEIPEEGTEDYEEYLYMMNFINGYHAITDEADPEKALEFTDMSIYKEVSFDDSSMDTEGYIHETSKVLEIKLTFNTTGRSAFQVFRYHDDAAEELTALTARPAYGSYEDGTFYVSDGCIYIYTNKFSPYAISYTSGAAAVDHPIYVNVNPAGSGEADVDFHPGTTGETITLTAKPNAGYRFKSWEAVGPDVSKQLTFDNEEINIRGTSTATFIMPDEPVTIYVFFEEDTDTTYPVNTPDDLPNGSVSADKDRAAAGEKVTVTVTPDEGYVTGDVIVKDKDGNEIPVTDNGDGTYSFEMPDGEVTVTATFEQDETTYPVNTPDLPNGSVSADKDRAAKGEKVTVTVTPDEGYVTGDVTVKDKDGNEIPVTDNGDGTYSFEMPDGEVTVSATFKKDKKEESKPSTGGHGSTWRPNADKPQPSKPEASFDTGVSKWLNTVDHMAYMSGYTDGTFGPTKNMTRAEAAQMFYNLLLDKNVRTTVSFTDVPNDAWYATAVNTLASLGIVTGVGDGKFSPMRPVTRAEFVTMVVKFADEVPDGENIFSDVKRSDWFYSYVVGAVKFGWISGYAEGSGYGFHPNATITRAEAASIMNNVLGRAADEDYVDRSVEHLKQFSDLSRSYWAYYTILEATNGHDYDRPNTGNETWTGLWSYNSAD